MPTPWTKAAEGDARAPKIPEGYHHVEVAKVIRQKSDGSEFRTDKGPFLMLVFENSEGEEAAETYFLTDKAAWKLAQAMERMGFDLAKMEEAGVDISRFEDVEFARKQFIGRTCWVRVEHVEDGKYTNVEVMSEDELPRHARPVASPSQPDAQPMDDDDIPF